VPHAPEELTLSAPRGPRRRRFDDDEDDTSRRTARRHTITASPSAPLPRADSRPSGTGDPSPDHGDAEDEVRGEPSWSTYHDPGTTRGPVPPPAWVITDARAVDTDRGVLKSGKEADVSLVERSSPGGETCLLAVKRYRSAEHRMFHRDAGYLEGRRVRRSRETRAMATRTDFGRELIAGQWAAAEFAVLSRLWQAGAAVPYPVQLLGTELMIEFIGSADGVAAPRLAQVRPTRADAPALYAQMVDVLRELADAGYAHGDLSPYNVLVHEGRIVLIDLPQAVDLVGNPHGLAFLRRDCGNICGWFAAHHVPEASADDLYADLIRSIPGLDAR
jgi:RIO kinase 1